MTEQFHSNFKKNVLKSIIKKNDQNQIGGVLLGIIERKSKRNEQE